MRCVVEREGAGALQNMCLVFAGNFRGFERLIDAIGGVTIDVDRAILDDEYPNEKYGITRLFIPAGIVGLSLAWWCLRSVRLTTMADLFADRFGSRFLATLYAITMLMVAIVGVIAGGNVVALKTLQPLMVKDEAAYTPAERERVTNYHEFAELRTQRRLVDGRAGRQLEPHDRVADHLLYALHGAAAALARE